MLSSYCAHHHHHHARYDKCCAANCLLAVLDSATQRKAQCSPKDSVNGVCCTDDCANQPSTFECAGRSECRTAGVCDKLDANGARVCRCVRARADWDWC